MTCGEAEPLLHARLDKELDIANSANIDRHISGCAACAALYAALETLHAQIGSADMEYRHGPALEQKLAARLLSRRQPSFGTRLWRNAYVVAFAGVAALILILFAPLTRTMREPDTLGSEILDDHLKALQLSHLVDVPSSDQHTVKPWFQGKTAFSPPVPDLTKEGFILTGGRLDVIHQQPAAVIVYRRGQHVISLCVTPPPDEYAATGLRDVAGYHLLHWTKNKMGYWAVSDVDPTELRKFADLIRER